MQSLTERDFGLVEKLLNVIRPLLEYGKVHRCHERSADAMAVVSSDSAVATVVAPSDVLREHQNQQGAGGSAAPLPADSAGGASTGMSERRMWTELAFLMSRVVIAQKLFLMSYVTSDPGLMLTELSRMLLAFVHESCTAVAGSGKEARMRHVALLAQDRLIFLLRVFCSLKNCTAMLGDTGDCDNAGAALKVYDAICDQVVSGQHLAWMSQIYVWFCDEAARLARSGGAIPSAYVDATHDALRCILGCCTDHEGCAKAFLYSEPVACVAYMFYGLKLRISEGDLLRPYEDEHPIVENAKGTAADASARQTSSTITVSDSRSDGNRLGVTVRDELERTVMPASPIPQRPPGGGQLKTRYFTPLTASFTRQQQQQQQMPRVGTGDSASSASVASLVCPTNSSTAASIVSTSWAFDLPELSRPQLKTLLLGGRESAFDSLVFAALDVVVEVMRVTRDYEHWMVLSTVSNLLLLSKKSIEVRDAAAALSLGSSSASASEVSLPLSRVVAMYENIVVLFQLLFSVMEGIGFEKSARSALSASSAPATAIHGGTEKEAKKGNRKGTPPHPGSSFLSGGPSPSTQPRGARISTTVMGEVGQLPATTTVENSDKVDAVDTAQMREHIAQQIVRMVLQTDVHAVFAATKRVLECDRTLFRVLHSFCMLDARSAEHAMSRKRCRKRSSGAAATEGHRKRRLSAPKAADTTAHYRGIAAGNTGSALHNPIISPTGTAAAGGHTCEGGSGCELVFDAGYRFFVTSNFGDLRHIASDVGCSKTLDGGLAENADSRSSFRIGMGTCSVRESGMGDSGTIAPFSTEPLLGSAFATPQRHGQRLSNLQHPGRSEESGGNKKTVAGGGGSFAKAFLKSFFGNRHAGSGAVALKRAVAHEGSDDNAEQGSSSGSSRSSSCSSCAESKAGGSGSRSDSGASDDSDLLSSARGLLHGSVVGSLLSTRSFGVSGSHSPGWQRGSDSRHALKGGTQHRHHRRKCKMRSAYSAWRDVPSYTALARELVRIFNLVLADTELSVDVRIGAGLLLPSIVLRDIPVFRLYEGRVLIRNYLNLLLHELHYNIKLRGVSATAAADREGLPRAHVDGAQEQPQSVSDIAETTASVPLQRAQASSSSMMSGRAHLTQRELIAFAPKVIETLERTFKVLGVIPLTSDVASITELLLYFYCADGVAPLGVALERSFTRVVVLWLIGLVGAQCDEDIDRHAMEVLLHLMRRAVARGSLPKDSSTTLMVTPFGAATVVQSSNAAGVAVPGGPTVAATRLSADWANARSTARPAAANSAAGVIPSSFATPSTTNTTRLAAAATEVGVPTAAARSMLRGGSQLQSSGIGLNAAEQAAEADLCGCTFNKSFLGSAEFGGITTALGIEGGSGECSSTVEALSSVFRVLLGRSQDLLSPAGLATVLSLFTSRDSNLSRLGRECMIRSLEIPSVYPLYADVILDSDTFLLTQTLSMLSTYLTSAALTPVTRRDRRLWMQRCGCVDAVIRVLVRVLDSPPSTPNFMKVIPHLFQFLSAFESGESKPAQLSSTNFIASVAERLEKLEGMEYFIIVTQAVLDASMGTYGSVDDGYASAGGPGAHYTKMQVIGSFRVAVYNCAAEKPIFLDLLPSLLTFAKSHSDQLFTNLVEVLLHILECTSVVHSKRLADFALDHGLSQMLPYLELSGRDVEERLPFTGTAADLYRFWQPILLRAPHRSRLRFTSHGGVQVSVGLWPDTGFTISAWFKFDRLYLTIPLFEFHGVVSDGSSATAPLRGSSMAASLFLFGGDSMQLTINDGRRVTINESQALQNFSPQTWVHVCAVLHTTHVLDVYVSGFKAGTTAFPYFAAGAEVRVNVGFTDGVPHYATSRGTDASPLFSMGDIALWAQSLSRSQVEAELGSGDGTRCGTMSGGCPNTFPAKILKEGIPREMTLFRHMGVGGGAPLLGSASSTLNLSVGGLGTLMNPKSQSTGPSGMAGLSPGPVSSITAGVGSDFKDDKAPGCGGAWSASAARMARFVPFENEDDMLRNVLAYPTGFPVIAKLVGRYATPPKTWVDYPLLWASRGGIVRMLDWMHLVTSSAQLEGLLKLILECVRRTTLAVTLDPRTYVLLTHILTNDVARYMTKTACNQLLELASAHINIFDEEHRVVINRLVFEHILSDVGLYAALRRDAALHLLQRVRGLFHTSQCRYAKHNARFVSPYRFLDRLLHSLVGVAARISLRLRRAVVQVAQQVVAACDMEDGLVQIFISLIALLTPEEVTVSSRRNTQVKVEVPGMGSLTRGTEIPLRTANHLTTLLLSSLVECCSQSLCVSALSRTIDLPWYAMCMSRYADPAAVVYATHIFFEAVQHNPALQEEVTQHQSAVVEVLTEHAVHEDLILLLLALTVGATRDIDLLSSKHSLRQQLDSLLSTCSPEPNALVAPIFVQLLVIHLHRIVQSPWRHLMKAQAVLQDEQRLPCRVRRYFSLVRVCSRLMILIRVRRYRALLNGNRFPEAGAYSVETPILSPAHHPQWRSSGAVSGNSQNVSFACNRGAGVNTGVASTGGLANGSFVSGCHSRAPPDPLSINSVSAGAAIGVCSGEDNGAATSVASPTPRSQSLRDAREFRCSDTGGCGGDGYREETDPPLDQAPFDDIAGLHRPLVLPASVFNIRGDDHSSSSSAVGSGDVSQWKPPVLLPEMWAGLPRSLPPTTARMSARLTPQASATAATHRLAAAASSSTSAVGGNDADDVFRRVCQVPAAHVVSQVSAYPMQHHLRLEARGADNCGGGDGAAASMVASVKVGNAHLKEMPAWRVHSRKHRRAFSALRVSVLLWLPLQVKRCRWASKPHSLPYEEDLSRRHAGTLFCIRMLHRFASMSNYFYLLVNSPMQTAALSSLVAYISRAMLLEQLDMWDQMVRSMVVAPARESAVVTATAPATVADVPQPQQQEKETPVSPTASQPADDGIEPAEGADGDWEGVEAVSDDYTGSASLDATPRVLSTDPVMVNATKPIASHHSRSSNSSTDAGSVGRGRAQKGDEVELASALPLSSLPETLLRPLTCPSSMMFRSAGSSSAQLDKMTVLESPHPSLTLCSEELDDADVASAAAQPRCRVTVEDGDGSSVTNGSFDVVGLPLIQPTDEQPKHRRELPLRPQSLQQRGKALPPHTYTETQADEIGSSATARAAASVRGITPTAAPTATAAAVEPDDSNTDSVVKPDATGNCDDDDGTSSVSSAAASLSSHSSTVSTSLIPTSASSNLPSTALDAKKAVSTPLVSFSNLPGVPAPLRCHGLSDVYAMNIASIIESVGEVVRRDAVSILRALIRSSLDTLPMPNWIGGPAYGSCGGLLFQLLFNISAKAAAAGDSTTTLVRYFLLCVGNAVKEQRDRDLMQAPNHDQTLSSSKGDVSAKTPMTGLSGSPLGTLTVGRHAPSSTASPLLLGCRTSTFSEAPGSTTTVGAGASLFGNAGGLSANVPLASAAVLVTGVPPSTVSSSTAERPFPIGAVGIGGGDDGGGCSPQHGDAPLSPARYHVPLSQGLRGTMSAEPGNAQHQSRSSSATTATGACSDVFLFNVSHFTDLIVDMLAIQVLDLPMTTHFFLTLLVLCQGWPNRYVDQLSWQVMRACIAVLNRPSTQDASVSLIESVYTLSTLVLRRGWKHKGVLESLLRVLYRVFVSLPPAWMPDADARHRKRLITLIFRHLVRTYVGTKELEKALTVRTLTQRLSLYDDFRMVFSLSNEDECCATFEQYCIDQFSSIDTLMSSRLKAKADLAFKASIKARSEYIKRIKTFNGQYRQVMEVPERYRRAALRVAYTSRFSSFVATTPHVDSSQLHWLLSSTCALHENHTVSHATLWRKGLTTNGTAADSGTAAGTVTSQINASDGAEHTLYHFMDPQMNYGALKGVRWGGRCASQTPIAKAATRATTACGTPGHIGVSDASRASIAEETAEGPMSAHSASTQIKMADKVVGAEATTATEEYPPKNDLVHAVQCEELVQHIAVLVPPLSTHCRPYLGDEAFPAALKELPITLTPSAITLLRYLVAPHETVRFLSNGFRINGIHTTPCLILLTNVTLKVIGFSRVTEAGDIILCENEFDDDDAHSRGAASGSSIHSNSTLCYHQDVGSVSDDGKGSLAKSTRRNPFSVASMTRQLQKLFSDKSAKRRQQQDGTRVAQAVRQVMGCNYRNIYWTYRVSSIRAVRSLHYMHLDTAVQLQLYYDNGPMLSVVDATQSMNPSAKKEFIKVLKDVVGTQQCTFMDESQRAASMRTHLVRWATGLLSNYEYLRFLNEAAGRTNRDLNQYPVFPWVLANYTSATLDLEAASTFRDFAYPMGAQTETRRATVARLFEDTRELYDADTGKSYPFHHGTHYSTSGGVLYFLIRVQPFTTYARLLQGGDFDLATRLFDSVAASFTSCVTGPADCKELIPEFYVNSGFLANADHLNFGTKSDGHAVGDVRLPPWAKNSRQVFTAVMRYALECPYVVAHLHQWIDLVFGVRRRGPLALERYNVFQRMTYGEEVVQALKNAETPHDCDVIVAEVDNFGQTPLQLFQERHPSHHELAPIVKASAADGSVMGVGGGVMASSDSHGNGDGGSAAVWTAVNSISAVALGGLYTSATAAAACAAATAGAGIQVGVTSSNLLSSGSFASGQTYTQAFYREAPKVTWMLIHAMDETQTWFVLRDPPGSVLQHPPPSALKDMFGFSSDAVLHFSVLRTSKKLACAYARLVPVADTDYYLCWHEREAQLMRYTTGEAAFHSAISFHPRDVSGSRISAVAVGPRESVLLVATSSGAVYCLLPDDTGDGQLHARGTLCHHRSSVTKIALDSRRHRAVTITDSTGDDEPILWRVQRSGCCFVCRLQVKQLLRMPARTLMSPTRETTADAAEARTVVDVAIDTVSGNVALVTARSLLLFDNNGEPFGMGTLPSPTSLHPVGTATLEDDNGDVGVVVSRPVLCVADITAVAFYQTSEWAAGMGVLLTGHRDGSLSAWRTTRLPPHSVVPGKIAMVEFHTRLFSGTAAPTAAAAGAGVAGPQDTAVAVAAAGAGGRGSIFMGGAAPLSSSGTSAGALGAPVILAAAGATSHPVTALHQENAGVPTFLVGYANGTVRQLVFEDPALSYVGVSGGGDGAASGSSGNAGDDRSQRR
ncbi:conserved hypothetical protein [Leishmania major strain Friedlin]|uniref:BEACH domain-containing protein n=1 Tax=Leishmania major TaxID=5664 RepID=Q4Q3Q7_LEIMA|nr:conserved hypothetical protein [Leishmania major strain Friedlin]CAG9580943.1 Concanavalin_A-like_lectin/glucanases_superfamily/Beige/BEACH_domain_containing_protein_-_putative [Leishmania major strain Friedlin]CAJ06780.1 conserved hypothetical protein [Leishmania major strain Friedlin]|eukprot:XP_001686041.1 conserved hypothetical protein [Leishmania major strain Friedlin]